MTIDKHNVRQRRPRKNLLSGRSGCDGFKPGGHGHIDGAFVLSFYALGAGEDYTYDLQMTPAEARDFAKALIEMAEKYDR